MTKASEIFNIITEYIRTNLAVLEIITTAQRLDKERFVFNILRSNLEKRHLKLNQSDINKLYLSYLFKNKYMTRFRDLLIVEYNNYLETLDIVPVRPEKF